MCGISDHIKKWYYTLSSVQRIEKNIHVCSSYKAQSSPETLTYSTEFLFNELFFSRHTFESLYRNEMFRCDLKSDYAMFIRKRHQKLYYMTGIVFLCLTETHKNELYHLKYCWTVAEVKIVRKLLHFKTCFTVCMNKFIRFCLPGLFSRE